MENTTMESLREPAERHSADVELARIRFSGADFDEELVRLWRIFLDESDDAGERQAAERRVEAP